MLKHHVAAFPQVVQHAFLYHRQVTVSHPCSSQLTQIAQDALLWSCILLELLCRHVFSDAVADSSPFSCDMETDTYDSMVGVNVQGRLRQLQII